MLIAKVNFVGSF